VPADQQFVIKFHTAGSVQAAMHVFDAWGKTYAFRKVGPASGDQLIEVSCASWPPGTYSIQVSAANGKHWVGRMVVSH